MQEYSPISIRLIIGPGVAASQSTILLLPWTTIEDDDGDYGNGWQWGPQWQQMDGNWENNMGRWTPTLSIVGWAMVSSFSFLQLTIFSLFLGFTYAVATAHAQPWHSTCPTLLAGWMGGWRLMGMRTGRQTTETGYDLRQRQRRTNERTDKWQNGERQWWGSGWSGECWQEITYVFVSNWHFVVLTDLTFFRLSVNTMAGTSMTQVSGFA